MLTHFITASAYHENPELNLNHSLGITYSGLMNASQVMGTWQRYQNKDINEDVLTCYGHRDGGGGTTPQMLEEGQRLAGGVGRCPVVKQAGARGFFHRLEQNLEGRKMPKRSGELHPESHRRTYASMTGNKKQNRRSGLLLGEAKL